MVRVLRGVVPSIVALLLGLLAGSVLMWAFGLNPFNVFYALFDGALGTRYGQSTVLTYMSSYILLALAFLIPGKAGIWNVGGQGQVFIGGITAALVVVFIPMPIILWPLVAVIAACITGAGLAAVSGILEAYRNASAIVTTIMLNYVAQPFSSLLLYYVIVERVPTVAQNQYVVFPSAATLPAIPFFNASIMFIIAILVAIGAKYFLQRTSLGYNIRAVGMGPKQAESKGINPKTIKVIAMLIGGALAGLAGAGDVLSAGHGCYLVACYQDNFAAGWFGGEGFAGIAVALVAANDPIGAIFSGIFFSILAAGTASVGQNIYVVWAMQGIIIVFMAAPYLSTKVLNLGGKKRWT